jgi:hypothetical protein
MSSPVRPPGVEKTSRLDSRDPVASGVKCRPHGGKNSGTKSWMVSWSLSDRPGRCRREASKQRTRVGIARLASRLSKVTVTGHPCDGENLKTSKFTLEGHVSLVIK